jgi:hypothetical protein
VEPKPDHRLRHGEQQRVGAWVESAHFQEGGAKMILPNGKEADQIIHKKSDVYQQAVNRVAEVKGMDGVYHLSGTVWLEIRDGGCQFWIEKTQIWANRYTNSTTPARELLRTFRVLSFTDPILKAWLNCVKGFTPTFGTDARFTIADRPVSPKSGFLAQRFPWTLMAYQRRRA